MRKHWRLLAESIAGLGLPVVRFDYPGTGDSLGAMTAIDDAARWTQAIGAAADFLRAYSGVKRFVFVGQSLGATLAMDAAARRSDVAGLVLITPSVSGRAYVADAMSAGDVLGFSISRPMMESLRRLEPLKSSPGSIANAVVFDRADRKAGAEVSEHFKRHGASATFEAIKPSRLVCSADAAEQCLPATTDAILAALGRFAQPRDKASASRIPLLPATLRAEHFREEPQRFGDDGALQGMLCHPTVPRGSARAFILLNQGLMPQTGFGRSGDSQARALAEAGYTSLRFDCAGVGDSADRASEGDAAVAGIRAAVDRLAALGHTRIVLVGTGSRACLALAAASADARVTHVAAINARALVWSGEDRIAAAAPNATSLNGALSAMARARLGDVTSRLPAWLRSFVLRDPLPGQVAHLFKTLSDRGTRVSLAYGERDAGLSTLRSFFGRALRLPGFSVSLISDAEPLTSAKTTDWLVEHLIDLVSDGTPREIAMPERSAA